MGENQPAAESGAERRVAPRLRTLKRARVLFNNRFSTIDCVVRNVSRTGALLTVDTAVHLPMRFELAIGDEELRPAKLVYRRETFAGIRFLDVEPEEDLPDTPNRPIAVGEADMSASGDAEPAEGIARLVHRPLPAALVNAFPWMRAR